MSSIINRNCTIAQFAFNRKKRELKKVVLTTSPLTVYSPSHPKALVLFAAAVIVVVVSPLLSYSLVIIPCYTNLVVESCKPRNLKGLKPVSRDIILKMPHYKYSKAT